VTTKFAKIIGNIRPEDEYMHELGPEPNFNESMYFNFFDAAQSIGGFVRLGNRANEHRAEMTTTVFLPDGRVLFNFKRPEISNNDAFEAGGMRFEVLRPVEHLKSVYKGSVIELTDPRAMADPRKAFTESPRRKILLDLDYHAVGPLYGNASHQDEESLTAEKQFAKAHYEQHMRVTGRLEWEEGTIEIDAFGLRDHSWGPRYWQALRSYEWLTMNFGDEMSAMVSVIDRGEGAPKVAGVIIENGELDPVVDAQIAAEYEDGGLYHKSLQAQVTTKAGRSLTIDGTVKNFLPLRNRREGKTTHIGEGMTEWRVQGRTGYGLSEFLRQT